ncbi:MAG: AhpC/TSA family protein [Gammaproteobacteria bacterium]|nr:AhpC/TSA family protein [Gammaproteobacteria bacterium]
MSDAGVLSAQTQQLMQDFISGLSEDAQKTVGAAFEKLMQSDAGANAPATGDKAPDFELPNVRGGSTQLTELLKQGPVVLSFYRGGWCPFCNLEFKALSDALPKINAKGASLIGISPELPDTSLSTIEKFNLPFEVLSDVGNKIAAQYGLIMTVADEMRPLYLEWGIDVPTSNGDESYQLPIPATYIIKQDGTIKACYVNKDYTSRMEPQAVLDALDSL